MITPEIKKFLAKFVSINTSNPPGNETEAANFIFNFLKNKSYKIELIGSRKRKNIISFFGNPENKSALLFNGHLDTVPFNRNEWQTDPLKLTKKKGYYYGRGVADMKGGITASIFAILKAKKLGYLKDKQIIFAGSADEETGADSCLGSKIIVDYLLKNKIKVKGALIPEPSKDKELFSVNLGHRGLIWIKIKSFGRAAHSGLLNDKSNTILKMQKFIQEVYDLFPKRPKKIKGIPQSSVEITFIKSGNNRYYNQIPEVCEANFDIRISPYENNTVIINQVLKISRKFNMELSIIKNTPSSKISNREKIVEVFENVLKLKKYKYRIGFASPTCDAHWYINAGIPTINGVGPVGKNIHAPNECMLIESLSNRIDLFADLIKNF